MSMQVQEIFRYQQMSASGMLVATNGSLGGFLCTTAGTLQITAGTASGGADIVKTFDVVEGSWYPLPFKCPTGAYAVLAGSAEGTFAL